MSKRFLMFLCISSITPFILSSDLQPTVEKNNFQDLKVKELDQLEIAGTERLSDRPLWLNANNASVVICNGYNCLQRRNIYTANREELAKPYNEQVERAQKFKFLEYITSSIGIKRAVSYILGYGNAIRAVQSSDGSVTTTIEPYKALSVIACYRNGKIIYYHPNMSMHDIDLSSDSKSIVATGRSADPSAQSAEIHFINAMTGELQELPWQIDSLQTMFVNGVIDEIQRNIKNLFDMVLLLVK